MQIKFKELNETNIEGIDRYCDETKCSECKNANYCRVFSDFPFTTLSQVGNVLGNLPCLKELPIEILDKEIELTDDEKTILNNVSSKYRYIARDKDGYLYVYGSKPEKNEYQGVYHNSTLLCDSTSLFAYNHIFNSITWESGAYCFRKEEE